ncbi:zinc-ribbon domain-containing protein [Mesobacterium pallidum]|uniref:zinc-ribbon domain-containing protein n=1 Tax=Mesobacterium pallidum TaxID=2872037 RepID=UPI001EE275FD|nr:zinc-ribbon domain-containing protein [Mesobacterium pallidum]
MRLICPNCGAQYEVPDEVIPATGRDVQCSSCGHTWFQSHGDQEAEAESELGRPVADEDWVPEDAADDTPEEIEERPPVAAPAPQPTRRKLDPAVADILRDEAQREVARRQAAPLETQPELGLDEPMDEEARRAEQARVRMARMRGMPDKEPATPRPESTALTVTEGLNTSRRDLLPDIDEINSTLRSASERREGGQGDGATPALPEELEAQRRTGFRRGFALTVLLFTGLAGLYVLAPRIVDSVPALAPALTVYVATINDLRLWLADLVAGLSG